MNRFILPKSNTTNRKRFFGGFINRVYLSDDKAYIYRNVAEGLPDVFNAPSDNIGLMGDAVKDKNTDANGGNIIPFAPLNAQKKVL